MRHFAQSVLRTLQTRMGNQLSHMFIPVSNSSPRQRQSRTGKIGEGLFSISLGLESKGMTSSPPENNCPTAEKLPKTSGVKQERQVDKGKQELHPDRSDETSNEQTLKQNEEELQKKEQELQEKEKEIEELKRKEKDAQHKLQQQDQENKALTARIKELEKEVERLNAEIKTMKEELKKIKGNQHFLSLAAMCDRLQKNFYQIVFYPHDFREYEQSYQARYIERDITEGYYGLTTKEKKRQAKERWKDLKRKLGWKSKRHVRGIKQLKYDRNLTAHPKITKDMKESLEDGAKALKLDEPTSGILQNLIDMWFKTEDLVQEQEEKKNKEQTA